MFQPLALGVALIAVFLVTSCGNGLNKECCDRQPPAYRTFPSFLEEESYDAATLATTVNHYVSLGEAAALADLRKRAAKLERDLLSFQETRIGHLAHLLWGSSGERLRCRADGVYIGFENLSLHTSAWPHFPMVQSGESFFVMTEGRMLAGVPEPLVNYLDYCRHEGKFRRRPVPVPTRDQALRDLDALEASPRWRSLRGKLAQELAANFMRRQIPPEPATN